MYVLCNCDKINKGDNFTDLCYCCFSVYKYEKGKPVCCTKMRERGMDKEKETSLQIKKSHLPNWATSP